jgi:hypothetical protein
MAGGRAIMDQSFGAMSERTGDSSGLRERLGTGIPSRPLLGALPLRRVIPQDVHSVMDYVGGATLLAAGLLCRDGAARAAGITLGATVIATSLMTDYRLSLAKIVPIEMHEVADYVAAAGALAAPATFGRRGKATGWIFRAVGLTTLLGSLFTDYRAQTRGIDTDTGESEI